VTLGGCNRLGKFIAVAIAGDMTSVPKIAVISTPTEIIVPVSTSLF